MATSCLSRAISRDYLRKYCTNTVNDILAGFAAQPLEVRIGLRTQHPVAADQLLDAGVERHGGLVAGALDARVGDDVVALVGVLADRSLLEDEARQVLVDHLAQLPLG